MQHAVISIVIALLGTQALAQTTTPGRGQTATGIAQAQVFDGKELTRSLMRDLAASEGFGYVSHTVCVGYDDCGTQAGNLSVQAAGQRPTIVNLAVKQPNLGTVIYDISDVPCGGTRRGGISSTQAAILNGSCFGGYLALFRSRHTLDGTFGPEGWSTTHGTDVKHWSNGAWQTVRKIQKREWLEWGSSSSAARVEGESIEVVDGKGRLLHREENEASVIASDSTAIPTTPSITTKQKCDAVAEAAGSLPVLGGSIGGGVCTLMDALSPFDTVTAGIPGVASATWADTDVCSQNNSVGVAMGSSLEKSVRAACYLNPGLFNITSGGSQTGAVTIADLDEIEFANSADEIESEPLTTSSCTSFSEELSFEVGSESCTITVTTICTPGDGGSCNCAPPDSSEPVCE